MKNNFAKMNILITVSSIILILDLNILQLNACYHYDVLCNKRMLFFNKRKLIAAVLLASHNSIINRGLVNFTYI